MSRLLDALAASFAAAVLVLSVVLVMLVASYAETRCPEPGVNYDSLILRWHRVSHSNDYLIYKLVWFETVKDLGKEPTD